ncbi:MAG: cobyrinate a,c-diamide synthase [Methanomicrobiaceae archaeon]|nr:cobyrinate a,c-diamide synthase [Methanomicrobiaceae archaeon]
MVPRIVIAGTHSGCGKTSIASGIMAALVARGLVVQPFKVGPDFIDPSHHTAICRRPSRNLDPFMMGEEGVAATFARAAAGADIAVIEGVMGLYDGLEGSDFGSTAHVAKILAAPLVLVADVRGASRSANAMVKGYREFDTSVPFGGVIYNRVGSARHRAMIEEGSADCVFGWIPWQRDRAVESRHLGLQMAHETDRMGGFGAVVEECCDLDALLGLAQSAPPLNAPPEDRDDAGGPRVRIGVAWDEAFCFYYQDNFDLLRRMGAELVFFSPMADALPEADALYFGGGYPELHAGRLEKAKCRIEIRRALDDGMPAYGECGGLVYLSERLKAGGEWSMVGVLPAEAEKMDRFQALGYVDASCAGKNPLFAPGTGILGHEFHYTLVTCAPDARFALHLSRGEGIVMGRDGLFEHNVLAGYTHAYFTPEVADAIVGAARRARRT